MSTSRSRRAACRQGALPPALLEESDSKCATTTAGHDGKKLPSGSTPQLPPPAAAAGRDRQNWPKRIGRGAEQPASPGTRLLEVDLWEEYARWRLGSCDAQPMMCISVYACCVYACCLLSHTFCISSWTAMQQERHETASHELIGQTCVDPHGAGGLVVDREVLGISARHREPHAVPCREAVRRRQQLKAHPAASKYTSNHSKLGWPVGAMLPDTRSAPLQSRIPSAATGGTLQLVKPSCYERRK